MTINTFTIKKQLLLWLPASSDRMVIDVEFR